MTINIDSNFLEVGRGWVTDPEDNCDGTQLNFASYDGLRAPGDDYRPPAGRLKALQCLLKQQGHYQGRVHGRWTNATVKAFQSWQGGRGLQVRDDWTRKNWIILLAAGEKPVLKFGSTGPAVRRLQRALNAAGVAKPLVVNGLFKIETGRALRAWQKKVGVEVSGVASRESWRAISSGRY